MTQAGRRHGLSRVTTGMSPFTVVYKADVIVKELAHSTRP